LEDRARALCNPQSGLASDYLNVFNELVMLVEQLPDIPEVIDDIAAWRPISYVDYFGGSNLPGRAAALASYQRAPGGLRAAFEAVVADLDRCATGCVAAIRLRVRRGGNEADGELAALCAKSAAAMHALLRKATDLVDHGEAQAEESAQNRADRLLAVRIQALRDVKAFRDR
jgi:hypothetical protein